MPTYDKTDQFRRDYARLGADEKTAFMDAVRKFLQDPPTPRFRKGLRVKGVKGTDGIFEMTWGDGGRATFQYGPKIIEGQTHIIWRRIGGHDIFSVP